MNLFARLFRARRAANQTTVMERARLGRTMPGQTGAMAGARYGFLVN